MSFYCLKYQFAFINKPLASSEMMDRNRSYCFNTSLTIIGLAISNPMGRSIVKSDGGRDAYVKKVFHKENLFKILNSILLVFCFFKPQKCTYNTDQTCCSKSNSNSRFVLKN